MQRSLLSARPDVDENRPNNQGLNCRMASCMFDCHQSARHGKTSNRDSELNSGHIDEFVSSARAERYTDCCPERQYSRREHLHLHVNPDLTPGSSPSAYSHTIASYQGKQYYRGELQSYGRSDALFEDDTQNSGFSQSKDSFQRAECYQPAVQKPATFPSRQSGYVEHKELTRNSSMNKHRLMGQAYPSDEYRTDDETELGVDTDVESEHFVEAAGNARQSSQGYRRRVADDLHGFGYRPMIESHLGRYTDDEDDGFHTYSRRLSPNVDVPSSDYDELAELIQKRDRMQAELEFRAKQLEEISEKHTQLREMLKHHQQLQTVQEQTLSALTTLDQQQQNKNREGVGMTSEGFEKSSEETARDDLALCPRRPDGSKRSVPEPVNSNGWHSMKTESSRHLQSIDSTDDLDIQDRLHRLKQVSEKLTGLRDLIELAERAQVRPDEVTVNTKRSSYEQRVTSHARSPRDDLVDIGQGGSVRELTDTMQQTDRDAERELHWNRLRQEQQVRRIEALHARRNELLTMETTVQQLIDSVQQLGAVGSGAGQVQDESDVDFTGVKTVELSNQSVLDSRRLQQETEPAARNDGRMTQLPHRMVAAFVNRQGTADTVSHLSGGANSMDRDVHAGSDADVHTGASSSDWRYRDNRLVQNNQRQIFREPRRLNNAPGGAAAGAIHILHNSTSDTKNSFPRRPRDVDAAKLQDVRQEMRLLRKELASVVKTTKANRSAEVVADVATLDEQQRLMVELNKMFNELMENSLALNDRFDRLEAALCQQMAAQSSTSRPFHSQQQQLQNGSTPRLQTGNSSAPDVSRILNNQNSPVSPAGQTRSPAGTANNVYSLSDFHDSRQNVDRTAGRLNDRDTFRPPAAGVNASTSMQHSILSGWQNGDIVLSGDQGQFDNGFTAGDYRLMDDLEVHCPHQTSRDVTCNSSPSLCGSPCTGQTAVNPSVDSFDALREMVYSEVAALISQNEARPHYLVEMFRSLQQLTTDSHRQLAVACFEQIVNDYLSDEQDEDACFDVDTDALNYNNNSSHSLQQQQKLNKRAEDWSLYVGCCSSSSTSSQQQLVSTSMRSTKPDFVPKLFSSNSSLSDHRDEDAEYTPDFEEDTSSSKSSKVKHIEELLEFPTDYDVEPISVEPGSPDGGDVDCRAEKLGFVTVDLVHASSTVTTSSDDSWDKLMENGDVGDGGVSLLSSSTRRLLATDTGLQTRPMVSSSQHQPTVGVHSALSDPIVDSILNAFSQEELCRLMSSEIQGDDLSTGDILNAVDDRVGLAGDQYAKPPDLDPSGKSPSDGRTV